MWRGGRRGVRATRQLTHQFACGYWLLSLACQGSRGGHAGWEGTVGKVNARGLHLKAHRVWGLGFMPACPILRQLPQNVYENI